jgi:hypothetical protein
LFYNFFKLEEGNTACYIIFYNFLQTIAFLFLLLVWVAGWLWAFYNQEQPKQPFFNLLLEILG